MAWKAGTKVTSGIYDELVSASVIKNGVNRFFPTKALLGPPMENSNPEHNS